MNSQERPVIVNNNNAGCFGGCLSTIIFLAVLGSLTSLPTEYWIGISVVVLAAVALFYRNWRKQNEKSNKEEISNNKNCPYCGEEILKTAKKCKHCNEWLIKKQKKTSSHNKIKHR